MKAGRFASALAGSPLLLFLLLPPLALMWKGSGTVVSVLRTSDAIDAVVVSLKTTFASLLLLIGLGTPLASWLARSRHLVPRIVESLVELPLVLPPAAAGIGLLLAFGRHGLLPTNLPFSVGAVIAAQVFVAAPLYVGGATAAFASTPSELREMGQLEGATWWTTFTRISLPVGAPVFFGGAAMAWARALGEFGATILFAGSLAGKTETLPLAIYFGFESNLDEAIGISVVLLVIAAIVLVAARLLSPKALVS